MFVFHSRKFVCFAAAAIALALAAGPAHGQYRRDLSGQSTPTAVENPAIVEKANAQIPLDLRFTRSDGAPVKLGDFFNHGRPVILDLVYFTCPKLCGETQNSLANAVREGPRSLRVGKDYDIVVVSIDPDDTTEAARTKRSHYLELMQRPETEPGVVYLTGTDEAIRQLAGAVGFGYHQNFPDDLQISGKFAHATGIFICTPYGRLSQTILGLQYDPDMVHFALTNAAGGKIGSGFLETVALPCGAMRFNPNTGQYENNPWFWAGTAVGLGSLAFMGIFLGLLWRGEFKKNRHRASTGAVPVPRTLNPTGHA